MKTFALSLVAAVACASDTMPDGSAVDAHYEIVTTTTTVEHVDVAHEHEDECTTNCVYNDFVLVYNSVMIEEWAHGIKAEYDLLMHDWERSLEHFAFEMKALNEDYWVMFRPLIEERQAIGERRYDEMITYVMENTYFHGAHIHDVVPEIEAFMRNEFNPVATNIVSMFGLQALTLQDSAMFEGDAPTFSYNYNEDEVVAWFRDTNARYAEIAAKYQSDFNTFSDAVNQAVADYEEGVERVNGIYESILENAYTDAELYWEMHWAMPEGMEDYVNLTSTSSSHYDTTTTTTTTTTWSYTF